MKSLVFALAPLFLIATAYATVDREQIKSTVRKNNAKISACYNKGLKENPELAGKLLIEWDVDDKGQMIKAEVNKSKSTFKNEKAEKCVIEELKSWNFPAAPRGQIVSVSFPFAFSKTPKN